MSGADDDSILNTIFLETANEYYRYEWRRLLSFYDPLNSWPVISIRPSVLARYGFYYTKHLDIVRCFSCNLILGSWQNGDDPLHDHIELRPDCSFLRNLMDIPIYNNNPTSENVESTINDINHDIIEYPIIHQVVSPVLELREAAGEITNAESINNTNHENSILDTVARSTTSELDVIAERMTNTETQSDDFNDKIYLIPSKPKNPKYQSYDARLKSFDYWPISMRQTKEEMADAGFYYSGRGDGVLCYHCLGGLMNWESNDDPWIQHAKWFGSNCYFILAIKGRKFVEDCMLKIEPPVTSNDDKPTTTKSNDSINFNNSAQSILCKLCYDNELSIMFLPCRHVVCCGNCAANLTKCVICCKLIDCAIRAIIS